MENSQTQQEETQKSTQELRAERHSTTNALSAFFGYAWVLAF